MNTRPAIQLDHVWFNYPSREQPSLADVTIDFQPGEVVCLAGPTGCGKSTLLRCLNGLIPHETGGGMRGEVFVNGRSTLRTSPGELCRQVGLVFQSPDDQLFSTRVCDEVAFGLENLSLSRAEIRERLSWALEAVGLGDLEEAAVANLSGGQKQRVAIASVLAMRPEVLVLDEPTSQLDPMGARQVFTVLDSLRRQRSLTVILAEHRLAQAAPRSGRILLMDSGRVVLDSPTSSAFDSLGPFTHLGLRIPPTVELFSMLGLPDRPLSLDGAARILRPHILKERPASPPNARHTPGEALLDLENAHYRYTRGAREALRKVTLSIRRGERVAVMGPNGGGKSTLLGLMAGVLRPTEGTIRRAGPSLSGGPALGSVGFLVQNPDLMLMSRTVREEVSDGPSNMGLSERELTGRVEQTLGAFGLSSLAGEPPLGLSRGQRLRVALASVLSMRPALLLLDEPTTGQDRDQIARMMEHLTATMGEGAMVFCTHDGETVLQNADRLVVLVDGEVIADGRPLEVLSTDSVLERASLELPETIALARLLGLPPASSVKTLALNFEGSGHA